MNLSRSKKDLKLQEQYFILVTLKQRRGRTRREPRCGDPPVINDRLSPFLFLPPVSRSILLNKQSNESNLQDCGLQMGSLRLHSRVSCSVCGLIQAVYERPAVERLLFVSICIADERFNNGEYTLNYVSIWNSLD